jgi:hypothetical protein
MHMSSFSNLKKKNKIKLKKSLFSTQLYRSIILNSRAQISVKDTLIN